VAANPDPTTSVNQGPQSVDSVNNAVPNNANNAQTSVTQPVADTATSQDPVTPSDNNMVPLAQSQAVMDSGASRTYQPLAMSIPSYRSGLIRPTMSSTYSRPPDQAQSVQPGIITASIFAMFGILCVALVFVRRWRRNRTRRRTRSVINLLNRAKAQEIVSSASEEKFGERSAAYEMETGLTPDDNGLGSNVDSSYEDLAAPVAAKTRPESAEGFKEGPFPTAQRIPSTFNVKFNVPHAPTKPSPLRVN